MSGMSVSSLGGAYAAWRQTTTMHDARAADAAAAPAMAQGGGDTQATPAGLADALSEAEQRQVAEDTIADVNESGLWPGKVVTELAPAGDFWLAEPEHQDYLERYPNGYTCHFVRPGWKLPKRAKAMQQA